MGAGDDAPQAAKGPSFAERVRAPLGAALRRSGVTLRLRCAEGPQPVVARPVVFARDDAASGRAMIERPILFPDAMVRAILAGTKTQTRRVRKLIRVRDGMGTIPLLCPYGAPGDRLWVRECFALSQRDPEDSEVSMRDPQWWDPPVYRADYAGGEWSRFEDDRHVPIPPPWRPSIHMPRWASRLSLEITSVRVERVQSISEEDARAEGVDALAGRAGVSDARGAFCALWDSINVESPGCSWAANPWVWVVGFRRAGVSR